MKKPFLMLDESTTWQTRHLSSHNPQLSTLIQVDIKHLDATSITKEVSDKKIIFFGQKRNPTKCQNL